MRKASGCHLAGLLLLMLAGLLACARNVPEVRHVVIDARHTLLIASDASAFKDAVRGRIFSHYKTHSNVEVINIARLKSIHAADFDAVLIMDTCLGWSHFNPTMKAFLDSVQIPAHVVLFMTVDDTDWDFSYQGVDAFTAASRIEDEKRVADELIQKLEAILQKNDISG